MEGDKHVMASAVGINRNADQMPGTSRSNHRVHKGVKTKGNQSSSASSSKFKGVVPQQNGHWGAQIYANHQRIWLGTFKSEKEAASAYDSAAIKLRSGDTYRNFPWTHVTLHEPAFQSHYTTEAILNMIKDGSYPSKFSEFLRTCVESQDTELSLGGWGSSSHSIGDHEAGYVYRELFQKELTPSDVGKLNRLVIPKKYAIKYFPKIEESTEDRGTEAAAGDGEGGDDVGEGGPDTTLTFHDRTGRTWKFRYCYWKSSQSFVFTRGWNRFVKENELKSKDIVSFYRRELRGSFDVNEGQDFRMIDVTYNKEDHGETSIPLADGSEQQLGSTMGVHKEEKGVTDDDARVNSPEVKEERGSSEGDEANNKSKPVRLFGVDISKKTNHVHQLDSLM